MSNAVYTVRNLNKIYHSKEKSNHVIRNLKLDIFENDSLGILGANGAGKTTLIKMMIGILASSSGTIAFCGKDNTYLTSNTYKSQIGIVLEGNRNLYWYMTILENLLYFGSLLNVKKAIVLNRTEELLNLFDLQDAKDRKVGYLSRGMQQKVAIMIALLNDPKILFLDEPTLGLDVLSKKTMMEKIKHLHAKKQLTLILTTHQIDVLEALSKRVVLLKDGCIKYDASIEQLKKFHSQDFYTIKYKNQNGENVVHLDKAEAEKFLAKILKNNEHLISYNKEVPELEEIIVEMIQK